MSVAKTEGQTEGSSSNLRRIGDTRRFKSPGTAHRWLSRARHLELDFDSWP